VKYLREFVAYIGYVICLTLLAMVMAFFWRDFSRTFHLSLHHREDRP
jgi:hypothetical protein